MTWLPDRARRSPDTGSFTKVVTPGIRSTKPSADQPYVENVEDDKTTFDASLIFLFEMDPKVLEVEKI